MFRRLGLLLAVLALFSIAGGHWTVLQGVAWAGMLRDYTQKTGSVATAVAQTFDGEHPCELCRQIADAKAKERREQPAAPKAKDDAKVKALVPEAFSKPAVFAVAEVDLVRAGPDRGSSRTEQPPTPPPRRALLAA